jgi:pimeloyl-ACP methyl ester carboxylesterase
VDYVRTLATQFPRIDTTRVVLMGHSAGGQLALWAASRKQNESTGIYRSSRPPLAVAGVVSLAGITDLAEYGAVTTGCNGSVTPLMGGTAAAVPDRYRAVSPMERVPIGVPVQLVHGEADPIVPLAQSRKFLAHNRSAGGVAELSIVPGAGHFDLVAPQSAAWGTVLHAVHVLTDVKRPPSIHVGGQ